MLVQILVLQIQLDIRDYKHFVINKQVFELALVTLDFFLLLLLLLKVLAVDQRGVDYLEGVKKVLVEYSEVVEIIGDCEDQLV